jgi:hypothetical protein
MKKLGSITVISQLISLGWVIRKETARLKTLISLLCRQFLSNQTGGEGERERPPITRILSAERSIGPIRIEKRGVDQFDHWTAAWARRRRRRCIARRNPNALQRISVPSKNQSPVPRRHRVLEFRSKNHRHRSEEAKTRGALVMAERESEGKR